MVLNDNIKVFVIYINNVAAKITIHIVKKALIFLLLVEKVIILAKYLDLADLSLKKLAKVLPKYIEVNQYAIKLEKSKKLPYRPI